MSVDWLLREQKGLLKKLFGCFCEKLGASLLSAVHTDELQFVVTVAALYRLEQKKVTARRGTTLAGGVTLLGG